MQPNKSQVHIDKPLTDMTIGFMQSEGDFISKISPVKTVSKQTDLYFKYLPGEFARDQAAKRVAGTESQGTGFSLSTDSYRCEKYALHVDFDYDTLANTDAPLDLEQDGARLLAQSMLIRQEKLFADAVWTTGVWGTDILGASTHKFSDYTNSDPILVIDGAKKLLRQASFVNANTLILGEDVFLKLKEHPDLVDRMKYTSSEMIGESLMARLFGVQNVVVAKSLVNTANEGKTDSLSSILGSKHALLCYLEKPGIMTKSAFQTFAWTGAAHLPRPNGVVTRRFEMESTQSRRIETEICLDVKVTAPACGVFFNDIVA